MQVKARYLVLLIMVSMLTFIYLSTLHWVFELILKVILLITYIYGAFIFIWPFVLALAADVFEIGYEPEYKERQNE